MKKKQKLAAFFLLLGVLTAGGCAETPQESAVISKADGLSETSVAKPMKEGETREIEVPGQWKDQEKRGNDRVTMEAELEMETPRVGNLPVLELQNHELTQEELEELVSYFAEGEKLYVPRIANQDDYQEVIDRIDQKEGKYANPNLAVLYGQYKEWYEKAAALAPEKDGEDKETQPAFGKKQEDPAKYAMADLEEPKKNKLEIFFDADVGEDRNSHISAENYSADAGNSSSFQWQEGEFILGEKDWNSLLESAEQELSSNGAFTQKRMEILGAYEVALKTEDFSVDQGQKQAEVLLEELNIQNMELHDTEKALWFPSGAFPDNEAEDTENRLWLGNPEDGQFAYTYIFSRNIGGLFVDQLESMTFNEGTQTAYAPPFPVEEIRVTVTADRVVSFDWQGICREVSVVAENTQLIDFETVGEKLFDYIYYHYTAQEQPAESKAEFTYTVTSADLGYTYIPAYKNPSHAWLVPAWFFRVRPHFAPNTPGLSDSTWPTEEFMVNALDAGQIAKHM